MFHNSSGHLRHIIAFELSATASCIQNKVHLINIVPELCSSSVNRFLLTGYGRSVLNCICTSSQSFCLPFDERITTPVKLHRVSGSVSWFWTGASV